MKTETTRKDLIEIRDGIDKILTRIELGEEINVRSLFIALFRAVYAGLNFLIRKTWGE